MSWRLADVDRLSVATGRRLLRVAAAGADQVEFVFERLEAEEAELLVTIRLTEKPEVGRIDLPTIEGMFGEQYGLGVAS